MSENFPEQHRIIVDRYGTALGDSDNPFPVRQVASEIVQFTIPDGTYGVEAEPADLGAFYDVIRVFCPDTTYIPEGSYMSTYCSPSYPTWPVMPMCAINDPGSVWQAEMGDELAWDFLFSYAAGVRHISFNFDQPVEGDLDLYIYGGRRVG